MTVLASCVALVRNWFHTKERLTSATHDAADLPGFGKTSVRHKWPARYGAAANSCNSKVALLRPSMYFTSG